MTITYVPQPIPEPALRRLRTLGDVSMFPHLDRVVSRQELLQAVAGADVLFALGNVAYDAEVLAAAGRLRMIAAMHPSAPFVDKQAAARRGIPVTGITNDRLAETTAEFTMALLLSTAWRIGEADAFVRGGRWAQNQSMAFLTRRLAGTTLGIVGFGDIGTAVARRARAFDMDVLYHKRRRLPPAEEQARGAAYRDLDALFAEADAVVVSVALTRETEGLVGSRLLSAMKPTAILVNTSRGRVLDEAALEDALRAGRLAGAGLDVFEREPPAADPGPRAGLRALSNVVLTPHIGSAARETREEMAHEVVDCIEAFLAGQRPPRVLNPEVYGDRAPAEEIIG